MKWPDAISIKQIALAFITGLLVLVSLIGGFAAYQTRAVTRSLEQHNQNAATIRTDCGRPAFVEPDG